MERPPEAAVISDNNTEGCDKTKEKCDNGIQDCVTSPKKFIEVNHILVFKQSNIKQ